MSKKVVIDRFEGKFVVVELEERKTVVIPVEIVPEGAKEGDVLIISVDAKSTQERKKSIQELFESLKEEGED